MNYRRAFHGRRRNGGVLLAATVALSAIALSLCTAGASRAQAPAPAATPPETWKEHWFEHNQLLTRVSYDGDIAVYFDPDVPRDASTWIVPFMTKLWKYTKATYGPFGTEGGHGGRLYTVFHQGRYSGGHPSTYFDGSHDFRDVSDCGPGPWDKPAYDIPSHEVAHIVEGASRGVHGSAGWDIWHDSKWAEFYQYDVYVALGMDTDARRLYDKFTKQSDNFPQTGTYWFRDWFYPLWRDHGHAKVMADYFALAAKYFPTKREDDGKTRSFVRSMNWGEYVHFMSGAAKTDLKPLATGAFGWPAEREAEYQKARKDFPQIKY